MENPEMKIAPLAGKGEGNNPPENYTSNSAHDQRQRLLEWLKTHGSIDTITARRELDILCPAARVLELRQQGHLIDTVWINHPTDCGKVHRVALYVLLPSGGKHE